MGLLPLCTTFFYNSEVKICSKDGVHFAKRNKFHISWKQEERQLWPSIKLLPSPLQRKAANIVWSTEGYT
jgi:hypothetical protein